LIRRANRISEPTSLTVGPLTMDLIRRKVNRSGQDIELQPREFALLEYLMRHTGYVVSKTMIMEHVWDYNFGKNSPTCKKSGQNCIKRLAPS